MHKRTHGASHFDHLFLNVKNNLKNITAQWNKKL